MKIKNLSTLLSKIIVLFLIIIIGSSCSKGDKEIVSYYENQKPKLIYYYKTENGIKAKVFEQMYYENGKLKYEGAFKNNNKSGEWKFFFEDGKKFALCDFTKNQNGDNWQVYKFDNTILVSEKDKVKNIAFFSEGGLALIRVGDKNIEKEYKFFPSFKLMEQRSYKGNILNGQASSYYENGNINSMNFFKDGMQDSIFVLYFENGSTQVKGLYKMDNKIGKWEFFKEDGSVDGEEVYSEDGSIIKARDTGMKYYDKNGKEIIINKI